MIEVGKRPERKARREGELKLLMLSDGGAAAQKGYNLKELVKAEKNKSKSLKGRKNKRKLAAAAAATASDDFEIDTADPRFAQMNQDPQFHLDPTNPLFQPTAGMKALVQDKLKRVRHN